LFGIITTAWQECYDDALGHHYYWDTTTNNVVWEMPEEYRLYVEKQRKEVEAKSSSTTGNASQNTVYVPSLPVTAPGILHNTVINVDSLP
jgi:hypothetical protein